MKPFLVFDLDDTLYPEQQFVRSGFHAAGEWLRQTHGTDGLEQFATRLFDAGQRDRIFDLALERLGLPSDLVPALVVAYRTHLPDIRLFDDARDALAEFGSAFTLGLLTDGYLITQQQKVAALSLSKLIQVIIFSDEFGRQHWKPSPTPYRRAMELAGCNGAMCMYIADNPAKDFIGARRLGWQTVRIRRPDGLYASLDAAPGFHADREIDSLAKLRITLAELGFEANTHTSMSAGG